MRRAGEKTNAAAHAARPNVMVVWRSAMASEGSGIVEKLDDSVAVQGQKFNALDTEPAIVYSCVGIRIGERSFGKERDFSPVFF